MDRVVVVRWRRRRTKTLRPTNVEQQANEPRRERKRWRANVRPHFCCFAVAIACSPTPNHAPSKGTTEYTRVRRDASETPSVVNLLGGLAQAMPPSKYQAALDV